MLRFISGMFVQVMVNPLKPKNTAQQHLSTRANKQRDQKYANQVMINRLPHPVPELKKLKIS